MSRNRFSQTLVPQVTLRVRPLQHNSALVQVLDIAPMDSADVSRRTMRHPMHDAGYAPRITTGYPTLLLQLAMRLTSPHRRSSVRASLRSLFAAVAIVGTLSSCGDDGLIDVNPLAGSYTATTFRTTPSGQSEIDVLAQGGSMTITIGVNNTTVGILSVPAAATGDVALQESMAGTAELNGSGVKFEQSADTFVRDLNWTFANNTISVTNQSVGGDNFTIVLSR